MEEVGGGRSCSCFQILFKEAPVSMGEFFGFYSHTAAEDGSQFFSF